MLFYLYDAQTKEYLGLREVHPDPRTGGYSAPAHSTHEPPPALAAHQTAVFDEIAGVWHAVADWRDVTFYSKATGEGVHLELGQSPDDATMTETAPAAVVQTETEKAREALAYSDVVDMGRVTEDLVDLLAAKGVLALADLPQAAQAKLAARKAERAKLAGASS